MCVWLLRQKLLLSFHPTFSFFSFAYSYSPHVISSIYTSSTPAFPSTVLAYSGKGSEMGSVSLCDEPTKKKKKRTTGSRTLLKLRRTCRAFRT